MTDTSPATSFRDRQKIRLLEMALTVLANEGLAAVQARRIAKDSGCSVGTLYNIFGDIDGLILAANERTLHELGASLASAAKSVAKTALDARLMALAAAYLDFATAHPRRWRAVFDHRLPEGSQVPAFYLEDRSRLLALIEAELALAIPEPQSRSDAAHALFSAVHGIVLLSLDEKLGTFDAGQCRRQIQFIVENVAARLS